MPLIPCPTCLKRLNVTEENFGKTVRCAACKCVFQPTRPAPSSEDSQVPSSATAYVVEGKGRRPAPGVGDSQDDASSRTNARDFAIQEGVQNQDQAVASLKRAGLCLFAGGLFGLLQFLVGCADTLYVVIRDRNPQSLGLGILFSVPVVAVAFTLVGSFHFRPRKSFGMAMMGATFSILNGLLNLLPCLCCGLMSTSMVAGNATDTLSGALIAAIFLFVVLPATALSLLGGIYALVVLFRPEVKGLFLD